MYQSYFNGENRIGFLNGESYEKVPRPCELQLDSKEHQTGSRVSEFT